MWALFKRDLILAFRSGGGFGLSLAFFLILVLLVPFGIGADPSRLAAVAPGILWIGVLLANLLSLDRMFQLDFEDGTLDVLATCPIPLEGIAVSKGFAHWVTTGLPLTIAAPFLGYMLNLDPITYPWLTLSLLIGTPALSFIGMFGAAVTVGIKRGGLLLSVLVLPLYIPSLIFGATVLTYASNDTDVKSALYLLMGISLLSFVAMPLAAAAALRANLR